MTVPGPPDEISYDLEESLDLLAALEDAREALADGDHLAVVAQVEHESDSSGSCGLVIPHAGSPLPTLGGHDQPAPLGTTRPRHNPTIGESHALLSNLRGWRCYVRSGRSLIASGGT
jgi:hypothetical protein